MVSPSTIAESEKWLQTLLDDCSVEKQVELTAGAIAKLKPLYCAKLVLQAKELMIKLLSDNHINETWSLSKELLSSQ